jgi:hypothetical protein
MMMRFKVSFTRNNERRSRIRPRQRRAPTWSQSSYKFVAMMYKRYGCLLSLQFSFVTLLSIFTLATLWTNNQLLFIERQLSAIEIETRVDDRRNSPTLESTTTIMPHQYKWSDIKLAIYMTTHLPESHLMYFPCWQDAIRRMDIFKYADLILYTSSQPDSTQLALLPFRNIIIKKYDNTGYQNGAIQAMIDPFVNYTSWFDDYDWVIRLNPDVLIRNDTWLIQAMLNTSNDGIFHECFNSKDCTKSNPKLHADFYAFRPIAVQRNLLLRAPRKNAEFHISNAFRNMYDSRRFVYVEGAINSHPGRCRIEGEQSPVVHSHDLWKSCPYYYNATLKDVY